MITFAPLTRTPPSPRRRETHRKSKSPIPPLRLESLWRELYRRDEGNSRNWYPKGCGFGRVLGRRGKKDNGAGEPRCCADKGSGGGGGRKELRWRGGAETPFPRSKMRRARDSRVMESCQCGEGDEEGLLKIRVLTANKRHIIILNNSIFRICNGMFGERERYIYILFNIIKAPTLIYINFFYQLVEKI